MTASQHLCHLILSCTFFLFSCSENINRETDLRRQVPGIIKDSIYLFSDNVFTKEKAELGRYLFYDRRLSVNNTKACASCHDPLFSFTDNYRRSAGVYGDLTKHNSPPLINLIFNKYLTYTDTSLHFPEQQIINPMFRENPPELGWKGNESEILQRFINDSLFRKLFRQAYPDESGPVSIKNIQHGISSFVKTILSFQSPYDDYTYRDKKEALSESAERGIQLFNSTELNCSRCHGGINFNQPFFQSLPYFTNGLTSDSGLFRIPTLRNLAFTAPYLHDGSAETLTDVIRMYEAGGKRTVDNKHTLIKGFNLNSQQRLDLINFLFSLSDSSVISNPAYANPFIEDETKR